MHLADIEVEFGDQLDEIKENKKVSEQHTFVSKEVSDRAHHGKSGTARRRQEHQKWY